MTLSGLDALIASHESGLGDSHCGKVKPHTLAIRSHDRACQPDRQAGLAEDQVSAPQLALTSSPSDPTSSGQTPCADRPRGRHRALSRSSPTTPSSISVWSSSVSYTHLTPP